MAVIQNVFKNLEFKLGMTEEIKLFKWTQKPIIEKISQLMEWNDSFGPESVLVKAAEQILELNYPQEYLKYSAAQQKFKHSHPFFIENEIEDVGGFIEWINSVFGHFEGLQEGLLGGLVGGSNATANQGGINLGGFEKLLDQDGDGRLGIGDAMGLLGGFFKK